jgi:hypothetical protein
VRSSAHQVLVVFPCIQAVCFASACVSSSWFAVPMRNSTAEVGN